MSAWGKGAGIALLVAATVIVGCTPGSSGSSESTILTVPPTTTTTIPSAEAAHEYAACLRDRGLSVDDIPLDANGRPMLDAINSQLDYSDPATVAAVSACAEILAQGALDLGYSDEYRAEVVDQLAAFSRCVRARGVTDFPDPVPGFIGIGSPYPAAEIPYDDAALPDAVDACRETVFGDYPGSGG